MKKIIALLLIFLCSISLLSSCKANCNHIYSLNKTKDSTCTEEGYNEYKCSECGDKYKETISAKGHTAGEAPTLDAPQVCTVCGTVLAGAVEYMPYRGNDLAINQYYGYGSSYITTDIVSQNLDRYEPNAIPFVDKNGGAYHLNLSIPIQDFFKHSVSSVLPLSTSDGKVYTTDSGFKLSFTFTSIDKDVASIHAWNQGLSTDFKNADAELLKIVGEYKANPSFYNNIYELVDFSDCYIEVAKKTDSGYESLKKIDSKEDWKAILQKGSIEISNDNSAPFYEPGTYRILFKYNMTWITDPPSAVYDLKDTSKEKPIYPYGKLSDQYEFFYVTITDERSNILLPDDTEISDRGFFCQLRASGLKENISFISENSILNFERKIAFNIAAKVDMTKDDYCYNQHTIEQFDLTLSVYNSKTDNYDEYKVYNLLPYISHDIVFGKEIKLDIGRDPALRDKKCRITLSYSFLNEASGGMITEQQDYYYTLSW